MGSSGWEGGGRAVGSGPSASGRAEGSQPGLEGETDLAVRLACPPVVCHQGGCLMGAPWRGMQVQNSPATPREASAPHPSNHRHLSHPSHSCAAADGIGWATGVQETESRGASPHPHATPPPHPCTRPASAFPLQGQGGGQQAESARLFRTPASPNRRTRIGERVLTAPDWLRGTDVI